MTHNLFSNHQDVDTHHGVCRYIWELLTLKLSHEHLPSGLDLLHHFLSFLIEITTMPAIEENSYDLDDHWFLNHEDDYSEIILHFRKKTKRTSIDSLTSMAGLESATEAYLFFQELQAGLSPIRILGTDVDELWCRLDWCSLILGMWVRRKGYRSGQVMEEWMAIMESWQFIIESTASMAICFALPSGHTQRVALYDDDRNVTSDRMFRAASYYGSCTSTKEDKILMSSVLRAARLQEWTTPMRHDRPFHTMIARVSRTIEKEYPKRILLQQRRRGIEASDFEDFVADIEKESLVLLGFLTPDEKEDLDLAFVRVFEATLRSQVVKDELRYLQICQKLRSQWLPKNERLQRKVGERFQNQVQETFGYIITRRRLDWDDVPTLPIDKDLSGVLALGADVRGHLYGRTDSVLFAIATKDCPINSFRALVAAGAPCTNGSEYDASPLHAAAGANNTDVIAFLLDRGLHSFAIDINVRDRSGRTALHWAARNCCTEAINMLLQQPKIEVDVQDRHGYTPFLLTAKAGEEPAMSRLLQSKKVNCYQSTYWSENALHLAAGCEGSFLLYLLRHVRHVNARDGVGETPLHRAVRENSGPNVSILLRNGADPSVMDDRGFTPFARACEGRHLGPMRRLLRGSRSLSEQSFTVAENILDVTYSDVSHKHVSPVTLVLHSLEGAGKKRLAHVRLALKIVLAAKPDLEIRDSKGQSVLSRVVGTVDTSMLQDILRAGADISSRDNNGKSILHKAIVAVDGENLQILLRAGMDVNSQDCNGDTPMHILLGRRFWDVEKLRMLLDWGANPDIKNHDGEDPVTSNRELHGESWNQIAISVIKDYQLQIDKARKALAKAEKRENRRYPSPERLKLKNLFSVLTLEGED